MIASPQCRVDANKVDAERTTYLKTFPIKVEVKTRNLNSKITVNCFAVCSFLCFHFTSVYSTKMKGNHSKLQYMDEGRGFWELCLISVCNCNCSLKTLSEYTFHISIFSTMERPPDNVIWGPKFYFNLIVFLFTLCCSY